MTDEQVTTEEIRRLTELGVNMIEVLNIALQTIVIHSREYRIPIPGNIPYLIHEATRLIQEINRKSLSDEYLQHHRTDEELTECQSATFKTFNCYLFVSIETMMMRYGKNTRRKPQNYAGNRLWKHDQQGSFLQESWRRVAICGQWRSTHHRGGPLRKCNSWCN